MLVPAVHKVWHGHVISVSYMLYSKAQHGSSTTSAVLCTYQRKDTHTQTQPSKQFRYFYCCVFGHTLKNLFSVKNVSLTWTSQFSTSFYPCQLGYAVKEYSIVLNWRHVVPFFQSRFQSCIEFIYMTTNFKSIFKLKITINFESIFEFSVNFESIFEFSVNFEFFRQW